MTAQIHCTWLVASHSPHDPQNLNSSVGCFSLISRTRLGNYDRSSSNTNHCNTLNKYRLHPSNHTATEGDSASVSNLTVNLNHLFLDVIYFSPLSCGYIFFLLSTSPRTKLPRLRFQGLHGVYVLVALCFTRRSW